MAGGPISGRQRWSQGTPRTARRAERGEFLAAASGPMSLDGPVARIAPFLPAPNGPSPGFPRNFPHGCLDCRPKPGIGNPLSASIPETVDLLEPFEDFKDHGAYLG